MIPPEYLTPQLHPDDYLPVHPEDLREFAEDLHSPGIPLANGNLPMPMMDQGVPIAFTHIDGVDDANLLDPSQRRAVATDREITEEGLILMRRGDDLQNLVVIGAAVEDLGWASPELRIIRFDIEKPVLSYDERSGLKVRLGGSAISSALGRLFPS